jgi:Ca-activated chloride channel family protein
LNLQYQYPQAFWLLTGTLLLALIFIAYLAWRRRSISRIGEPKLVKELFKGHSPLLSFLKFVLPLLAFALGCLAVANPRKPAGSSEESRKGIDVMIALDLSNSMLATDLPPSRLVRARQLVAKLITQLPDDRIGLVVFAGNAYVQVPLTFDHGAVEIANAAAHPSMISEQGTAIGTALDKCGLAFQDDIDRFRSIVLITDGENHEEEALDMAGKIIAKGIMINTIGIGSPEGSTIVDTLTKEIKKDEMGNVVLSKLNEPFLQQLAQTGKGSYILLRNTEDAIRELREQFSGIEKKALVDQSLFNYQSFYLWLVIPMLVLLLAEIFLPDRKKKVQ